jgi:alpha-galactosidase
MAPKVTIIGGGSSSFVPVLIRRLMQSEALEAACVSLMDIDAGRLGVMQALADKLIASEGSDIRVTSTLDQREALVGADFVIAAIAEGGMDAWAEDLEIPGRYGIVMHVGDSIGPGGVMRAFRNAPALAQVARNAAEVAPGAYIFNYTNPAPIEALAMRTAAPQVKSFGLCSCAAHASSREWLAKQAGVKPEDIAMPPVVAGINHCASIQSLRLLDGTDAMPLVHAQATEPVVKWALETYGVLPYCWTHWTEFFPQMQRLEAPYSGTAQGVKMRYGIETHDMDYERARVAGLEGLAKSDVIESIVRNGNITRVVIAPNNGAIPNLPDNAIVEVNAQINAYGVRPIHAGPLPEALAAHLRHYVGFQQHVVKAALSGDRKAALHAFLLDPTTQAHLDLDQTQALLDEMLEANRRYLPLFF